ncbi:sugar porter family MFS transporter [Mycolicibacterium smegmatis]|uniref:Arabinose-proton symporter n=1 Tax=Mycolicibacterium smegmatis (strain MKD8) TaxID=1214915 RepID=A0A2U9PMQ1_MYCSE|nr:sugar porter family MFS transporter [Mycolicibacterium smegmatis]AWT52968.1 arabinose-proton symporter [Mycolicibacterium smegmatis MKD8]
MSHSTYEPKTPVTRSVTPPTGGSVKAVAISIAAAVGGFLFGFDSSVINGAVGAITAHFALTPLMAGLTVASALLGCAVGAWFAGGIADRIGRVRVMGVAAVLFAVSSVGSGLAFSAFDLMAWRITAGVAIGIASVIAPAYIAEIAPARIRGALTALQQLALVIGIFVSLLSDAALASVAGGAANTSWFGVEAWRWMLLVGLVPAVVYAIIARRIPESPRYLARRGEYESAAAVLSRVLDVSIDDARRKVDQITDSLRSERHSSLSHLRGRSFGLRRVVWIGIWISIFQQLNGINIIFYYSTTLWQSVGFSESDSLLSSVITSAIFVVVTLVAIAVVDKIGRKPLLIAGGVGMAAMLAVMGLCFAAAVEAGGAVTLPGSYGPIALVAANLFVVAFGVSWGPVTWVMLGEIFPNSYRGPALAVAVAVQWIANFVVTVTFPPFAALSLPLSYCFYSACALLSALFVLRFVRETKGRELEEMDDIAD